MLLYISSISYLNISTIIYEEVYQYHLIKILSKINKQPFLNQYNLKTPKNSFLGKYGAYAPYLHVFKLYSRKKACLFSTQCVLYLYINYPIIQKFYLVCPYYYDLRNA